jgi:hypothetical protein
MSDHSIAAQRTVTRLSAACAIMGALLGLIVNVLHGDLPDDPEAALARVASSTEWGLLHLGIMASALLILIGLWGLTQLASDPLAGAFARLSLVVAVPGAAVMLVGIAIDGFATKGLADVWATAQPTDRATVFPVALAVEEVQNALFHTWAALFIGLPFVLLGVSGALTGGGFPRWLGVFAMIGGGGALFVGVAGFLNVPVPGLLFNVFALMVTLWVLLAGVLVWRAPGRPVVARVGATAPA